MPVATAGLIAGELAGTAADGATFALLTVPAFLGPALLRFHRRLGTIVALAGVAVFAGGLRAATWDRALRQEPSESARGRIRVDGWVREVRRGSWGSPGTEWARVEIEIVAAEPEGSGLGPGDRVRLSLGRSTSDWEIGDGVRARIDPRAVRGFCNGGEDSFARWLHRRGIWWTAWLADDRAVERLEIEHSPWSRIALLRGHIGRAIDRSTPPGTSGVLRALVIGDRGSLSNEDADAFNRTGTSHLLSVSGLHLALVWGATYALARRGVARVPRLDRIAAWIAVPRIAGPLAFLPAAGYAALTGGAVATLRALVMAAVVVGGTVLQRGTRPLTSLAAAAGFLAWLDPDSPSDASFQLSFASVAAILLGLDAMSRHSCRKWLVPAPGAPLPRKLSSWILVSAVVSAVASLATAPLTAHHFGIVSLVAVPANLVVGPVLGAGALGVGLLGAVALGFSEAAAAFLFWVAGELVRAAGAVVEKIAQWPWASVSVSPPGLPVVVALLLVQASLFTAEKRLRVLTWTAAAILIAGEAIMPRPAFRVSFLDVGQGDAAIVEAGEGRRAWAIDAGGLGGTFDTGTGVVVPGLRARGVGALAALVLSHAERDHYGGLAGVARSIEAVEFWWNGRRSTAAGFQSLEEVLQAAGSRSRVLHVGPGPGGDRASLAIDVLHPSAGDAAVSMNDASLVLAARLGAVRVLFTGDVEKLGEREMLESGGDLAAVLLKVPHHGSRTSSTPAFVRAVRPGLAVASLGNRNRFGFPAPEVVQRYRGVGAAWRATGTTGEVVIESDGQIAEVRTCRGDGV